MLVEFWRYMIALLIVLGPFAVLGLLVLSAALDRPVLFDEIDAPND